MIGVGVEEEDRMDQWIEDAESVSDSIFLYCDVVVHEGTHCEVSILVANCRHPCIWIT